MTSSGCGSVAAAAAGEHLEQCRRLAQVAIALRRCLLYLGTARPKARSYSAEMLMAMIPGGLDLTFEVGIQFIRFAAVGLIGTLGHYAVLVILVHAVGSDPVLASAAGAAVGAILNYFLNYRFTFNSKEQHRIALPRFLIVMAVGFNLNLFIMYVGVDILRIYYLVVQVFATGVVLVWNFIGNRLWTFGNDRILRPKGKRNPRHAASAHSGGTDGGKGFRSWLSRLT